MDEMPSAEFRKSYAKLREPVAVTVNGHVIGQWIPAGTVIVPAAVLSAGREPQTDSDGRWTTNAIAGPQTATPRGAFSTRPFTPVPKPGKR